MKITFSLPCSTTLAPHQNIRSTKLSYEFFAGVLAWYLLQQDEEGKALKAQAEIVAGMIFRHQDVQDKGMVTMHDADAVDSNVNVVRKVKARSRYLCYCT